MNSETTKRCLFWTILTAVLHGLLCWLLALVLGGADSALTWGHCWSLLVWLPLVQGAVMAIVPALMVGLILGHKRGICEPHTVIPVGIVAHWVYRWWFVTLPWFVELRYLYIPFFLLSAWTAKWAYDLTARRLPRQEPRQLPQCDTAGVVPMRHGWQWLAIVFVIVLLAHAYRYMPIIADDALISARYAERLLDGKGLTWTDGQPVEGYSDLLWILATAALGALGIDLIVAMRILGCACMAAVIVAVVIFYSRQRQIERLAIVFGLVFLSCSVPIAVWSIAGLEQPLVAIAIAGAIIAYWSATESGRKSHATAACLGTCLGILCLTRPDGPLFTVALAVAFALGAVLKCHRWSWPFLLTFVLIPVICYAGQLGFRLAYYHDWLPNTAYAKVVPSWYHIHEGWEYVWSAHVSLKPLSSIGMACLLLGVFGRRTRRHFIPLAMMLLTWEVYVVFIGGDIFMAHRHYVPVIVILAFALVDGMTVVVQAIQKELHASRMPICAGVVALCGIFAVGQYESYNKRDAVESALYWDARWLGEDLRQTFSEKQPLLAVTGAGSVPYWSKLPCLDMLGLNDYWLAHHRPAGIGHGWIGHELGNGEYVLRMKPDIILCELGSSPTPTFLSGTELIQSEQFARDYVRIRMLKRCVPGSLESPFAFVWMRRDSDKIGIHSAANRIVIPAYFFATEPADASPRDNHMAIFFAPEVAEAFPYGNHLVVAVDAKQPVQFCLQGVKTAGWKAEVHGQNPEVIQCHVRSSKDGIQIDLTTQAATPIIVDEVVLTREDRSKP